VIAHIGGVPVEEVLTPLLTVGGGFLVALTVPLARLRRRRSAR
jgi:hypothetical protein